MRKVDGDYFGLLHLLTIALVLRFYVQVIPGVPLQLVIAGDLSL